jgi:hypothetical protein
LSILQKWVLCTTVCPNHPSWSDIAPITLFELASPLRR